MSKSHFFATLLVLGALTAQFAAAGIRGYVDKVGANLNGEVEVFGWSCDAGREDQLTVHVYAVEPAGSPGAAMIAAGRADLAAEPAVAQACGTVGRAHRFRIILPDVHARTYAGQRIFVHGLSVTGGANLAISDSGRYSIPSKPSGIKGRITVVEPQSDGTLSVRGWTCDASTDRSTTAHLYAGHSALETPRGTFIARTDANLPSSADAKTICGDVKAHDFAFKLTRAQIQANPDQPIYVHGISLSKMRNSAVENSGQFKIPRLGVKGYLDRVTARADGSAYVEGWSCDQYDPRAINVEIYAGGPRDQDGQRIAAARADGKNEPAVNAACFTAGSAHRFRINLPSAVAIAHADEPLFIYGTSLSGGPNSALKGSGDFKLPKAASTQKLSALVEPGQDLVIPEGMTVLIDQNIDVQNVMVMGRLECPVEGNFFLRLSGLHVHGEVAAFECGTPERPFLGNLVVSVKPGSPFTGDHCAEPEIPCSDRNLMAMSGGVFRFRGNDLNTRWLKLSRTAEPGDREIRLSERVRWRAGDSVAISPTGANYLQAEDLVIESVEGNVVRLRTPLKYRHIGAVESYKIGDKTWVTDERAEVANLSRNIKFTSDGDRLRLGEKGAHMMVMLGGKAYVDGVEFEAMGRMGEMARYPFHWHRSGDVAGQFIKNSSIHHSFQRCVTVHGSLNATVDNNVCYDHYGHGFFLENGDETGNRITNNLGMLSRRPLAGRQILQSDIDVTSPERFPGPSTFWISNPSNVVTGNVAAGSQGTGFWMSFNHALHCKDHFCKIPDGQSTPTIYPSAMKTTEFARNVAKAAMVGFTWDGVNEGPLAMNPRNPEDRTLSTVKYDPGLPTRFDRLSGYKNRMAAMYARAMSLEFTNMIMAGNKVGFFSAYNSRLRNSLILARTTSMQDADVAILKNFVGARLYDGPFDLADVDFVNFDAFQSKGRAVSSLPFANVGGAERFFNVTQKLRFSPEPVLRVGFNAIEDDALTTTSHMSIHDLDGSLLGKKNSYVYPDHPMSRTDDCQSNPLLGLGLVCTQRSVNVYLINGNPVPTPYRVTRLDRQTGQSTPALTAKHYHHVVPALVAAGRFEYTYDAPTGTDLQNLQLQVKSERGGLLSPVIHMINLPQRNCRTDKGRRVASLEDLRTATDSAYFSENDRFSFRILADGPTDLLIPSEFTPMAEGSLGRLICD